jgi:hypothetical protein
VKSLKQILRQLPFLFGSTTLVPRSAVLFVMAAMRASSGFSWKREPTQTCPTAGGKLLSPFWPLRHPLGLAAKESCGFKELHSSLATDPFHYRLTVLQLHLLLKSRPKSCSDGLFVRKGQNKETPSQLLKLLQQQGQILHSQIPLVMFLLTWQLLPAMTTWCGSGAVWLLNWQRSPKMALVRKLKILSMPRWRQTGGTTVEREHALKSPKMPLVLPVFRWRQTEDAAMKNGIRLSKDMCFWLALASVFLGVTSQHVYSWKKRWYL